MPKLRRVRVAIPNQPTNILGSVCACGHVGDCNEPLSMHAGINGHGKCRIAGCSCGQFVWKGFLGVVEKEGGDGHHHDGG